VGSKIPHNHLKEIIVISIFTFVLRDSFVLRMKSLKLLISPLFSIMSVTVVQ